jgi:hypothetical protein
MGDETTRLAGLEARAAVADLVHRYALNIREGKGAACGKLFTEDAVFEVREAPAFGSATCRTRSRVAGREAIAAYVSKSATPDARVCPLISNLIIHIDATKAQSSCVMTTLVVPGGQQILGEYHDTFRYEDGWRFSSRTFTIIVGSEPEGRK